MEKKEENNTEATNPSVYVNDFLKSVLGLGKDNSDSEKKEEE